MKKLMIATAAAAIAGAGFADGVVYDMALSVKTTKAVNGKVSDKCGCYVGSVYRKQASYKVQGLFWGCDCYLPNATLVGQDPFTGVFASGEGNYIFWNVTDKGVWADDTGYIEQDFAWNLLGRIGNKAADCEGAWTLNIGDLQLMGAGFGKVDGCEEASIVKSLSGNFAGFWNPGQGCLRCADNAIGYWPLCECGEDDGLTAAYGTWSLKYNSAATKKFIKGQEFYKFPAYVLPAIAQFVDDPDDPTDPKAEAKKEYEKAVAAFEAAKVVETAANLARADAETALSDWLIVLPAGNPNKVQQTIRTRTDKFPTAAIPATTKAEDDAEALPATWTDATDNAILNGANGLTAAPYRIAAATVNAYSAAKRALRNAQAELTIAKKAKEMDAAVRWNTTAPAWNADYCDGTAAAGAFTYSQDFNGTDLDVKLMEFNIKHAATDVNPVTKAVAGADVDLAKDITEALDVLKGAINAVAALTPEQKAAALKIITDYDAAFANTESKKIAREAAALERIAATANMTADQITAKTKELVEALAVADEAADAAAEDRLNKQIEMASKKAICGAACE